VERRQSRNKTTNKKDLKNSLTKVVCSVNVLVSSLTKHTGSVDIIVKKAVVSEIHVGFVGGCMVSEHNYEGGGSIVGDMLEVFVRWDFGIDKLFAGVG